MKGIYLLLGSNLGDRKEIVFRALSMIEADIGPVIRRSSVYQTDAWGVVDQPDFLNMAVEIESEMRSAQVLEKIQDIERSLGRIKYGKWGSRLIDIDILYFGDEVIKTEQLTIPHPHIQERRFTLVPMCELAPDLKHPRLKKTQCELLESCRDRLEVKRLESPE